MTKEEFDAKYGRYGTETAELKCKIEYESTRNEGDFLKMPTHNEKERKRLKKKKNRLNSKISKASRKRNRK